MFKISRLIIVFIFVIIIIMDTVTKAPLIRELFSLDVTELKNGGMFQFRKAKGVNKETLTIITIIEQISN